mgnify:CR=1 FL=1
MLKHHAKLERHSISLLIGIILVVAIGGLIEIIPLFRLETTIEKVSGMRPLTPLEHHLRSLAGESSAGADFIGRYLPPLLYPAMLTRETQILLGLVVLSANVVMYWWVFCRPSGTHAS